MKKALDEANLKVALKRAANMLAQLAIEHITPKNYYGIFMNVFDEMKVLE